MTGAQRGMLDVVLRVAGNLNQWERRFVDDINARDTKGRERGYDYVLSDKQDETLRRIWYRKGPRSTVGG